MPQYTTQSSVAGTHVTKGGRMYPDSALPLWQMLVMISVVVASLVFWIVVVHRAGRDRGRCSCPGYDSPAETEVTAGSPAGEETRPGAGQWAA